MRQMTGFLAVAALLTAGCGAGTNKRIVTRPDDYNKLISFPSTGDPVDIKALEEEYPELKGIVMTAPDYIEEYARLKSEMDAKNEPMFKIALSSGTTIQLEIEGEPDLSTSITIPPTGNWYFPYIGKVRLVGLTIEEAQQLLKERYGTILKNPQIIVNLLSGNNATLTPQGFQTTSNGSTGEIIVMGGGGGGFLQNRNYRGDETLVKVLRNLPGDAEWRQIRVIRRDPIDPLRKSRVIICDLWQFIAMADVRQDIPLYPGDVVYVPKKWSVGDQFEKDWDLVLKYMGDALFLDSFKDAFRSDGVFRD